LQTKCNKFSIHRSNSGNMYDMHDSLPGLDLSVFESWMRRAHPELMTEAPLNARLITGGLSNLSFAISGGTAEWVLRRPPLGHVLTTAHDMAREYRVISALGGTALPVPEAHFHSLDDDAAAGVGAEFFLMDLVDGTVMNARSDNTGLTTEQLRELGPELGRTLALLHEVDPAQVGLAEFGRPEGFLTRQASRWKRQLDASRTRELAELDALFDTLAARIPESHFTSILHGDFRLDNALVRFADARPTITAVLDWEMSTLGDSLTDLGLFGVYWGLHEIPGAAHSPLASAIDPSAGYSDFAAIVDAYSSTRSITVPDLSWYLAFASYKLAVILEGIHYRYTQGQTVGEGFDTVGALVPGLAASGLRHLTSDSRRKGQA